MNRQISVELAGCTIVWLLASLFTLQNRHPTKQIQSIQFIQLYEQAPVLLSRTHIQKAVSVAFCVEENRKNICGLDQNALSILSMIIWKGPSKKL